MIELFKIVNGIYDHACITHFDFVELSKDLIRTRGNKYKFVQHHCHHNWRKFNFTNRVVPSWNSLSNHIVSADTVNTFKHRLKCRTTGLTTISHCQLMISRMPIPCSIAATCCHFRLSAFARLALRPCPTACANVYTAHLIWLFCFAHRPGLANGHIGPHYLSPAKTVGPVWPCLISFCAFIFA